MPINATALTTVPGIVDADYIVVVTASGLRRVLKSDLLLAAANVSMGGDALSDLIDGLDTRLDALEVDTGLSDHVSDGTDAHDASAVAFTPTGTIAATNVQDAIAEVASEGGGGGGGGSLGHKFVVRTSNAAAGDDYTGATGTYAAVDATNLSLTLTGVSAGDVVAVNFSGYVNAAGSQTGFDAVSIVGGSPVNYMSGAGSSGEGFGGWHTTASAEGNPTGLLFYTVQSGDLSSGSLTVRLYWRIVTGSPAKTLYARSILPVQFAVENRGPAQS